MCVCRGACGRGGLAKRDRYEGEGASASKSERERMRAREREMVVGGLAKMDWIACALCMRVRVRVRARVCEWV